MIFTAEKVLTRKRPVLEIDEKSRPGGSRAPTKAMKEIKDSDV